MENEQEGQKAPEHEAFAWMDRGRRRGKVTLDALYRHPSFSNSSPCFNRSQTRFTSRRMFQHAPQSSPAERSFEPCQMLIFCVPYKGEINRLSPCSKAHLNSSTHSPHTHDPHNMTSYGSMPPTEISQFSAFSTPPSAVSAVSARSAFAPSGFSSSAAPSAASESAFSGFSAGGDTAVSESRPNYSSSSKYSQPGFTYPNSSVAP